MVPASERYFLTFAAAFVRGRCLHGAAVSLNVRDRDAPLSELSDGELSGIFQKGNAAGFRLHKFKRTMDLARVRRVCGILRGLAPSNLLDVGSGRGAFLWPLLEEFPQLNVTAIDKNERRAQDIQAVSLGGVHTLTAYQTDATAMTFDGDSFDVVTALEVLEHIPSPQRAMCEMLRVARRHVVLSVPSKPDSNPEHIHVFGQRLLRSLLSECGAKRVTFQYVSGHLIAVVSVPE